MGNFYIAITAVAMVAAMVAASVAVLYKGRRIARSSDLYVQKISELYGSRKVVDCLCEARDGFSKGSMEYIAIDKAVFYLNQSIMRDYATAFLIIEKTLSCSAVKELHADIVGKEKANMIYLLQ